MASCKPNLFQSSIADRSRSVSRREGTDTHACLLSRRATRIPVMGVRRVVPDLSSQSLDRAKVFYSEVLGLQPVMDHGWILTLADPERPGAQLSPMTHDETAPVIPEFPSRSMTWTPAMQLPFVPARR